jgi:hypothetical protein
MLEQANKGLFFNPNWGKQVNKALGQLGTERVDGFSDRPSLDRVWFALIDMTSEVNIYEDWQQVYSYTGHIYTKQFTSAVTTDPPTPVTYLADVEGAEVWAAHQTIYSSLELSTVPRRQIVEGEDLPTILVPVVLRDSQWEAIVVMGYQPIRYDLETHQLQVKTGATWTMIEGGQAVELEWPIADEEE